MRFHLEDFWGKSPSRFVWAPRCCEKLMETGKNITSSTMESSLDGKLLTCGTWCRRRKEHLDLQNEERSKMGIFLKCHPCPDISFEPPEIFKFHLLFTSNIVFCVSFVSFLFPPSLKNSPKTISCPVQPHQSSGPLVEHQWPHPRNDLSTYKTPWILGSFWDTLIFAKAWSPGSTIFNTVV